MAIFGVLNLLLYVGLGIFGSIMFFKEDIINPRDREIAYFIMISAGFILTLGVTIFQCSRYQKDKTTYLPLATSNN